LHEPHHEFNIQKTEEAILLKIEPFLEEVLLRLSKMDAIINALKVQASRGVHAEENLLYTIDQVAQIVTPFFGEKKTKPVSAATVRRWIAAGLLIPVPDTKYRISGTEIKRFIQQKFF
ncbi:MAG: helix-turn-helix domain-containing protein, partial [Saprospiraceae bacterium]|nr:helix-turn-helix domain-containing protein [Saprospiraceae bacterium]